MLFQSQAFALLFLPIAATSYYFVAASAAWRQRVLIAASLFFYGWWDARFIPLLVGQIAATWLLAWAEARTARRAFLVAGIVLNLASLATFKYLDFLMTSAAAVTGLAVPHTSILLPIGISFFSFQLISYLVDRWRKDAPIYPFRPFALFVLVFPHLISGPIVRHNELIPQFASDPRRDGMWERISIGLFLFTLGLAKKVLLADRLGEIADPLFAQAGTQTLDFGEAWSATIAFTLQLFFDFCGYTDMAIGIALIFGLMLPENFRRPYAATDLREFWRRWHITLSNFIRDYLYIPLGGSRHGTARYVFATVIAMGVCGLWHGAGWTYVVWGLWHGAGLVTCRAWQILERPLPAPVAWALTLAFVMAGWVLFRAADFSTAASVLSSLVGTAGFSGSLHTPGLLFVGSIVTLLPSTHEFMMGRKPAWPAMAMGTAVLAGFCLLEVGNGPPLNFIYFRF